ncbi:hypothetical protein D3C72_1878210 [compost metagenome]
MPTIQSQPFRDSLARALASRSLVSAAKPTTSLGRFGPGAETPARMSGFSIRASDGGPPGFFLILPEAMPSTRQSATAALITAMSAGSAASTAAFIWVAASTQTRVTPTGTSNATGPEISVTSAPSSARAAATA